MLLPRIIIALIFIPVVLSVIWFGSLAYFLFIFGVCLLAYWEFSNMADQGGYPNQLIMGMFGGFLLLLSLYLDTLTMWGRIEETPGPFFIFILWIFLVFLREIFTKDKGHSVLRMAMTIYGVVICVFFIGHLILIRDMRLISGDGFEYVGREMTFFLFITIWITDTGAWFVGRMIGRVQLAPKISPKKTLEGMIGGLLLSCLAGWLMREIFLSQFLGAKEAVVYAFLISMTAQVSDLSESLLKRTFGVKDSSGLLPGHGGILDRFDSFIFAAPFFYYALLVTGRFQ